MKLPGDSRAFAWQRTRAWPQTSHHSQPTPRIRSPTPPGKRPKTMVGAAWVVGDVLPTGSSLSRHPTTARGPPGATVRAKGGPAFADGVRPPPRALLYLAHWLVCSRVEGDTLSGGVPGGVPTKRYPVPPCGPGESGSSTSMSSSYQFLQRLPGTRMPSSAARSETLAARNQMQTHRRKLPTTRWRRTSRPGEVGGRDSAEFAAPSPPRFPMPANWKAFTSSGNKAAGPSRRQKGQLGVHVLRA